MPKIMIINYQQFAKTNTFSLSFHILFSPFLHIFPQDTSKSGFGDGQKWGWTPPPPLYKNYVQRAAICMQIYFQQCVKFHQRIVSMHYAVHTPVDFLQVLYENSLVFWDISFDEIFNFLYQFDKDDKKCG